MGVVGLLELKKPGVNKCLGISNFSPTFSEMPKLFPKSNLKISAFEFILYFRICTFSNNMQLYGKSIAGLRHLATKMVLKIYFIHSHTSLSL